MGYITYPRTSGSKKDIKRAQAILVLIEQLLLSFDPNNLSLLLTLITRIGWANLPPALRHKLLQLLYYDLFRRINARKVEDAKAHRNTVNMMTKALVDVAFTISNKIPSNEAELSLHERLTASGHWAVSLGQKVNPVHYSQDLLIFDNGIHVILNAGMSRGKYGTDRQKEIRTAARLYDTDTLQTLKVAHKKGMLVTLNLLADYIIKGNTDMGYDLEVIPKNLMEYCSVRYEVLKLIKPFNSYNQSAHANNLSQQKIHGGKNISFAFYLTTLIRESALSFWVEDSQTRGTECRFLTIQLIIIARKIITQRLEPTLLAWSEEIESALIEFFTTVRVKRVADRSPRLYCQKEAEVLAACIKQELLQHPLCSNESMPILKSCPIAMPNIAIKLPNLESSENEYIEFL